MPDTYDMPRDQQVRLLTDEIARLRMQLIRVPQTPSERGKQVEAIVKNVCSIVDAAGGVWIWSYRPLITQAICDVLYGSAAVDLPSWH